MSCPTQKSFNEKISRFLEKMLSNVFGIHLSYLPSAHLYVDVRQRALKDKLLQKTLIHKGLEVVSFFLEKPVNIKAYPQEI